MNTTVKDPWVSLTLDDATKILIGWLKDSVNGAKPMLLSNSGYDIHLPHLAATYLKKNYHLEPDFGGTSIFNKYSYLFYDAAWDLCLRGILRMSPKDNRSESNARNVAIGNGYSITPLGHQWLQQSKEEIFIPTDPSSFSNIISGYREAFGDGFMQRSQEAIKCYNGLAFLACCVMCGAAAEAILLSVAERKLGNLDEVLKIYKGRDGRSQLEKKIIGDKKEYIKEKFSILNNLLKFWRDEASHGAITEIGKQEALYSLQTLLFLAQFVSSELPKILKEDDKNPDLVIKSQGS